MNEILKNEINPKSIVVRMPNWIGDLVMATPVLEELKQHFPYAKITVMCLKTNALLLKNNKYIDEIFSFEKCSIFSKKAALLIKELKEKKFDLGILLTNSFSSAYFFFKAKIKKRVGYKAHFRGFLLNVKKTLPKKKQHLVLTYLDLLQSINIEGKALPQIFLDESAKEKAKKILFDAGYKNEKILGINPFAAYGSAKCWPFENFKKLAEILSKEGYFLLFFGSKNEKAASLKGQSLINLIGQTNLEELAALISACDLFLTNDSGPMHIAAALRVPLIALFGSTDENITGPYKTGEILKKKTRCSPCFKRVCDKDFSCMLNIEVNEVAEAVKKRLK